MVIPVNHPKADNLLCDILLSGGIAIIPCDTIYGIIGCPFETRKRINIVKRSNIDKPLLILSDLSNIDKYTDCKIDKELLSYWPGPLTLIVLNKDENTAALRVPDDQFLNRIFNTIGKGVYSTSVNRSGEKPYRNIKKIITEFNADVDLIIDAGDLPENLPSTLLDITKRPYKILRQGKLEIPENKL